jgi:hypothetical protein
MDNSINREGQPQLALRTAKDFHQDFAEKLADLLQIKQRAQTSGGNGLPDQQA